MYQVSTVRSEHSVAGDLMMTAVMITAELPIQSEFLYCVSAIWRGTSSSSTAQVLTNIMLTKGQENINVSLVFRWEKIMQWTGVRLTMWNFKEGGKWTLVVSRNADSVLSKSHWKKEKQRLTQTIYRVFSQKIKTIIYLSWEHKCKQWSIFFFLFEVSIWQNAHEDAANISAPTFVMLEVSLARNNI